MQSVRNLVFLGRCCAQNRLDIPKTEADVADSEAEEEDADEGAYSEADAGAPTNGENNDVSSNTRSAIHYIFRQTSSLLRREVFSRRPDALIPKTASIALLAALVRHLDAEQIHPSLTVILLPLQHLTDSSIPAPRSSDESFQNTYKGLVSNCHEALDLLQKKLGTTEYIAQMSRVQETIKERREGRRVKRRIEAVADPERYGRDKQRRNERKRDVRREKGLEHRGKRRGW
jgi:U3 small nucleolar RNA-associated protein 20